jgi:diguanylate cyclase (GGDEF)-like protein
VDLQQLLNGNLPLDKVGPHLRHAARRALHSGDRERMLIVAKVITSELLRRGDLIRVAVEGEAGKTSRLCLIKGTNRLLDLGALGWDAFSLEQNEGAGPLPAVPSELSEPQPAPAETLGGIDSMLVAMEDAQRLDLSDPRSGETGVILESILHLLAKFTPQFDLFIMLFDPAALDEPKDRVFIPDEAAEEVPWMAAREPGHSVWIPRTSQLPRRILNKLPEQEAAGGDYSAVAVPLYDPLDRAEDLTARPEVGLLYLVAKESWSRDTLLRLSTRLSRFVTHRWQQHSEVNKRIHIDALTGLYNRGYFEGQFDLLLERARRNKTSLTLVLVDIDHFKSVNDDYDHIVGDQVLRMVARRLQEELRRIDLVCRLGGEEFALVLPDADLEAAREVLQRLLNTTFSEKVNFGGRKIEVPVTFSFGAVTYPNAGVDALQLYRQADTLLFLSKDRGRNQCHFWSNDGQHLQLIPGAHVD